MKRKLYILIYLFILITFFSFLPKTYADEPEIIIDVNQELRGVWLTPITGELSNYTSEAQFKQDMNEMLTILEYYNINALFFHVRTHNNALYESADNPKASWFSNVNFTTFDPLEWLISEAKSRGMEFHAWMNPYRVDSNYYGSALPSGNPASSPSNLLTYDSKNILNPGLPNVREFVIDTVMELVESYDVDAIHFDDYFYINLGANGATSGTTTILDEPDQSTFELYSDGFNTSSATDKAQWRRNQINLLVSGVKSALTDYNTLNNDYVQFGIAPTGIYKNGDGIVTYDIDGHPITTGSDTGGQTHYSSYLFSDSLEWITQGWVDYLTPQSYWATNHPVAGYIDVMGWWNAVNKNLDINLYSGIGVYMANLGYNTYNWQTDSNEFVNQLALLDTYENISGSSVYSYQYLASAYLGQSSVASTQINNVKNSSWTHIAVLPEIKSMTQVMITEQLEHTVSPTNISWNRITAAKNYYIFESDTPLEYTSDEIVGVIGQQEDLTITYQINTNPSYYYDVVPISKTNTLASPYEVSDVQMIPGASIRTQGTQGLKYQAIFNPSLLTQERGFFMVYGQATLADLQNVIDDDPMMINGKPVYKENNYNDTSQTISVVLTGIPESAYAQQISVFAYAFDGVDYTFVETGVTRSIGEVAFKAAKAGNEASVSTVLSQLEANYYTHHFDEFDNYRITGLYETDRNKLKNEFLTDWNSMFLTSYVEMVASTFHAHAKTGATTSDLSQSNLYEFFNDSLMSNKWGWLLDYLKHHDNIVWPTRQINAIQGDGTLSGYANLYDAIHLTYSISNFFNNAHDISGYGAIDFTGDTRYTNIDTFNQSIFIEDQALNLVHTSDTFVLPGADQLSGYTITGFDDGITVHAPGASYTPNTYEILTTQKTLNIDSSITYTLNGGGFYQYTSRAEMVNDFIIDFNAQSGKSTTLSTFYGDTYHASSNFVIDFFNSPTYSDKWSWMKTYILDTGSSTGYTSQANLANNTASTWRSNVWAFINADYRTDWPVSIDFSISANADGFWSSIEVIPQATYQEGQNHVLEVPFKLGSTFSGWYESSDFSGSEVVMITSMESGPKIYYAKWQ